MHVAHPAFGEGSNISDTLNDMLRAAPSLTSSDVKLLMMEKYETVFGICNHNIANEDRPLLLLAQQPSEDFGTQSLMYDRIEKFADYHIGKHFNISLTEFLDFPRDIVMKILEISEKRDSIESSVTTNMLNKLDV